MNKRIFFLILIFLAGSVKPILPANMAGTSGSGKKTEKGLELIYTSGQGVIGSSEKKSWDMGIGYIYNLEDNYPPVSEIIIGEPSDSKALNSKTPISILSEDPQINGVASGIRDVYFRVHSGTFASVGAEWMLYSGPFTVDNADGDYLIEYCSQDFSDNKEESRFKSIVIDNSPPEAELVSPSVKNKGVERVFNKIFPVTGDVAGSDLQYYELAYSTGNDFLSLVKGTIPCSGIIDIWDNLKEGEYKIKLTAYDHLLNRKESESEIRIGDPDIIISIEDAVKKPGGMVLDKDDNLYVIDGDAIKKFNISGEIVKTTIDKMEFNGISEINIDEAGNIFITDSEKTVKISTGGTVITQSIDGSTCTYEGKEVIDSQEYKYRIEGNTVVKSDKEGNILLVFGNSEDAKGICLNNPSDIALNKDRELYISDTGNSRILKVGVLDKKIVAKSEEDVKTSLSSIGPDPAFIKGEIYAFPNPAKRRNPVIHVECGIADKVEVKIYNVAAEMIDSAVITDKPDVINGKYAYEYEWDTSGIASGIYIYLINAKKEGEGRIKSTKKLGVIK